MKIITIIGSTLLLLTANAFAEDAASSSGPTFANGRFSLGVIQLNGDFYWNIAGDGYVTNPNILSELSWKDVQSQAMAFGYGLDVENCVRVNAGGYYGMTVDGYVQDSDYSGSNRTKEFSRSISDTGGTLMQLEANLDCPMAVASIKQRPIIFTPAIGLVYASQYRKMQNGEQVVSEPSLVAIPQGVDPTTVQQPPPVGYKISALNSHYQSDWMGFKIGSAISIPVFSFLSIGANVNYAVLSYKAEADWNLREELRHPVSFRHSASGSGYDWGLQLLFTPIDTWTTTIGFKRQHWYTQAGSDIAYGADGTIGAARLNEVQWRVDQMFISTEVSF